MSQLTSNDIKTVDELPVITTRELADGDSLLTFQKNEYAHKKLLVADLKAWLQENKAAAAQSEVNARASEGAAAASASDAASSASSSENSNQESAAQATLSESWAVGGTNTRAGEDTDNASYYATQAASSQAAAAASETNAASAASTASAAETSAAGSAATAESWAVGGTGTRAGEDTDNASYYATQAASSQAAAAASETNAASSASTASSAEASAVASAAAAATSEANARASADEAAESASDAAASAGRAASSESNADRILQRILEAAGLGGSLSPGIVFPYAGKNLPSGFLWCDGAAVSREEFAGLFAEIGTDYGEGDGSTTFNVPDYRECALVGAGKNTHDTIATHDTYTLGQFKDDQIQNHIHEYQWYSGAGAGVFVTSTQGAVPLITTNTSLVRTPSGYTTVRAGTITRGKRKAVNFIIKY